MAYILLLWNPEPRAAGELDRSRPEARRGHIHIYFDKSPLVVHGQAKASLSFFKGPQPQPFPDATLLLLFLIPNGL